MWYYEVSMNNRICSEWTRINPKTEHTGWTWIVFVMEPNLEVKISHKNKVYLQES